MQDTAIIIHPYMYTQAIQPTWLLTLSIAQWHYNTKTKLLNTQREKEWLSQHGACVYIQNDTGIGSRGIA